MSGLGTPPAAGLVITLNGGNDLAINNNGGFTFPSVANLLNGATYDVAIKSQPTDRNCSISAGAGTVANAPINNIVINCTGGEFTVGGAVTGLAAGASVVLTNNGGDDVTVSDGNPFAFPTTVGTGSAYNVQVKTQPSSPAQSCVVSNGTGTVAGANVTNVAVACTTTKFKVNVSVSGLAGGSSVVLTNNGGDALTVDGNKTVAFATGVDSGAAYAVAVQTQPTSPAQTCTVGANATGTIGSGDVTVDVTCSTSQYTVGGTVTGLDDGKTLVVTDSAAGTTDLTVTGAGGADVPFTFANPRNSGSGYNVSIVTQPAGQTCAVAGGSGTVGSGNITSVQINCATGKYALGGSVTGLASGSEIILTDGTDTVHVNSNGVSALQFPALSDGTAYNVQVTTQPLFGSPTPGVGRNQTCTVANATGTISGAAVTNLAVTCVTNSFKYSGQIAGLADGESITVTDTGSSPSSSQTKSVTGLPGSPTDTITFDQAVQSGSSHTLSTTSPSAPIAQTCVVADNGAGAGGPPPAATIGNGPVSSALINCTTNKYTVRVNVANLNGGSIVLGLTDADAGINTTGTVSSNGTSTPFGTTTFQVPSGTGYAVSVLTNPSFNHAAGSAAQHCTVTGGTGTVTNVDPVVNVSCTTDAAGLGGSLTGLDTTHPTPPAPAGSNTVTLRLTYTGIDGAGQPNATTDTVDLTRNANGAFTFPISAQMASNTQYTVHVEVQPADPPQTCRINGSTSDYISWASGTTDNSVNVNCSTDRFALTGVFDLTGGGELPNFTGCTPPVPNDSDPPASDPLTPKCGVLLQVAATGVTSDSSKQWISTASLNGANEFTFARLLTALDGYTVTVAEDPTYLTSGSHITGSRSMHCDVVSGGTGTVTNHDLTNAVVGDPVHTTDERVHLKCTTNTYTVGGHVSGLEAGSNLQLSLTDTASTGPSSTVPTQTITVTAGTFADSPFTFPTPLYSGHTYTANVVTGVTNANGASATSGTPQLVCSVDSGTGVGDVQNGNVDSIHVTCARSRFTPVVNVKGLLPGNTVGLTLTVDAVAATGEAVATHAKTFSVEGNGQTFTGSPTVSNQGTFSVKVTTPSTQVCTVIGGESSRTMPILNSPSSALYAIDVVCAAGLNCGNAKSSSPISLTSGVYAIDPDGAGANEPFEAYCDMTGDGWTLAIKASNSPDFAYSSPQWTTPSGSLITQAINTSNTAAIYSNVYGSVAFTKIKLESDGTPVVMDFTSAAQASLKGAIGGSGVVVTSGPTDAQWKGLISPAANLQLGGACTAEAGINSGTATHARVRIGTTGHRAALACTSEGNSFIGVGGQIVTGDCPANSYPTTPTTVGNVSPNGNGNIVTSCNFGAGSTATNRAEFIKVWLH